MAAATSTTAHRRLRPCTPLASMSIIGWNTRTSGSPRGAARACAGGFLLLALELVVGVRVAGLVGVTAGPVVARRGLRARLAGGLGARLGRRGPRVRARRVTGPRMLAVLLRLRLLRVLHL